LGKCLNRLIGDIITRRGHITRKLPILGFKQREHGTDDVYDQIHKDEDLKDIKIPSQFFQAMTYPEQNGTKQTCCPMPLLFSPILPFATACPRTTAALVLEKVTTQPQEGGSKGTVAVHCYSVIQGQ
jgi:hypothetical protein